MNRELTLLQGYFITGRITVPPPSFEGIDSRKEQKMCHAFRYLASNFWLIVVVVFLAAQNRSCTRQDQPHTSPRVITLNPNRYGAGSCRPFTAQLSQTSYG